MKKWISVLLVIVVLLQFAAAETVDLDVFSVDIPKEYSEDDDSYPGYRRMSNEYGMDYFALYQIDKDGLSLQDAASQLADMEMPSEFDSNPVEINGYPMILITDTFLEECKAVVFEAGDHFCMVNHHILGFWDDETEEVWDSVLNSIKINVISENRDSGDAEEKNDGTSNDAIDDKEDELYSSYTTLEKGSKGDEVKTLQQRLVDLYWLDGSVDGDYGNKTKSAVERFQEAAGIPVTGVADGKTQAKLFADDAPEDSMTVSCASSVVGNYGETLWYVNGQQFRLTGNQTKTLKTPWGTYKFNALGEYEKVN